MSMRSPETIWDLDAAAARCVVSAHDTVAQLATYDGLWRSALAEGWAEHELVAAGLPLPASADEWAERTPREAGLPPGFP